MKVLLALLLFMVPGLFVASQLLARQTAARFPAKGHFADIDGVRLHYTDYKAGGGEDLLPVVFIHGASGNLREQEGHMLGLLEGRARLIFIDRPGHGHSERGTAPDIHLPGGQARVVSGLLAHLGIGKAIVAGHSYGGAVAAAFAVNHPEQTAGAVFIAAATHPWPGGGVTWYYDVTAIPVIGWLFSELIAVPGGHLQYSDGVAGVFSPEKTPRDYESLSGTKLVLRPEVFRSNARDVTNLFGWVSRFHERYREIRVPVSVISGDSDDIVLAHVHSEGLARDIEGAELIWLEGVGHAPAWTRPEVIVREIERISRLSTAQK